MKFETAGRADEAKLHRAAGRDGIVPGERCSIERVAVAALRHDARAVNRVEGAVQVELQRPGRQHTIGLVDNRKVSLESRSPVVGHAETDNGLGGLEDGVVGPDHRRAIRRAAVASVAGFRAIRNRSGRRGRCGRWRGTRGPLPNLDIGPLGLRQAAHVVLPIDAALEVVGGRAAIGIGPDKNAVEINRNAAGIGIVNNIHPDPPVVNVAQNGRGVAIQRSVVDAQLRSRGGSATTKYLHDGHVCGPRWDIKVTFELPDTGGVIIEDPHFSAGLGRASRLEWLIRGVDLKLVNPVVQ